MPLNSQLSTIMPQYQVIVIIRNKIIRNKDPTQMNNMDIRLFINSRDNDIIFLNWKVFYFDLE